MICRKYSVTGRVQGVGFRYFVARVGNQLRLRGIVRNLRDGSVECVAGGSPEVLARLESQLRQGPPASQVAAVSVVEESGALAANLPDGFEIL
jgi:acylphosphatase